MSLPIIQTIQNNINSLNSSKLDIKNAVNTDYDFIANEQIESYPSLIKQGIAHYKNRVPHATKEGTDLSFDAVPLKFENMTIKGDTSQDSTTGKNKLKIGNSRTQYGVTGTVNSDGSITISGTASGSGNSEIFTTTNSVGFPAGTYTFSISHTLSHGIYIHAYTLDGTVAGNLQIATNATFGTATFTDNVDRFSIRFPVTQGESFNETVFMQLEEGSTATDYEPYTGGQPSPNPDYPQPIHVVTGNNTIGVQGINIFDGILENGTVDYSTGVNAISTTGIVRSKNYIPISSSFTIITKTPFNSAHTIGWRYYDKDYNYVGRGSTYLTNYATVTPNNSLDNTKTVAYMRFLDSSANRDITEEFCIRTDSSTDYVPYYHADYPINLGSLELCKIGDYQDYLYKENGNWYKYEAIEKLVLDGTETNWNKANSIMEGATRFYRDYNKIINGGNETTNTNIYVASNYFKATYWYDIYNINTTNMNLISNINNASSSVKRIVIRIDSNLANDVATFKTWLSTNNTIVYYVKSTESIIQITDETLIAQLNAIDKSKGVDGTTIITIDSDDLKPILNFTAYLKEVE